jgi:phosphotransferase system  glucose/maltose/N-acetylglucosamine-specific IIC component
MSLTVALAIILVCTLLSGMVSALVHRRVHVDVRRRHQEVGTAIFLQLGVGFAVLLAFVFSKVWSASCWLLSRKGP